MEYPFKDRGAQCPFTSLGVRVPAVLVSPWIGKGVFRDVLDHTSLLKYVCQKWKLPFLTSRVERANDFGRAILSTARQVPDKRIEIPFRAEIQAHASALNVPELSSHQNALRALCESIEAETQTQSWDLPQAKEDIGAMQLQAPNGDNSDEMRNRTLAILASLRTPQPGSGPSANGLSTGQADSE